MSDITCKVKTAANTVKAFLSEEQYCSVCRHNFNTCLEILNRIQEGEGTGGDLESLNDAVTKVINLCQCGAGKGIAEKLKLHLQESMDEFLVHIENRVCPSSQCPKLVLAPCQAACPAGIDIPNYISMVGRGRHAEALKLIREDVPLPGSLGRICEHPCERSCRRGQVDKPVSICALKRVAYDSSERTNVLKPEKTYDEKVAVIGGGPAGLSAAYFLAQKGYGVTIFEAMSEPGGMLAYGIPSYRLPRKVLRDEIARIKDLGVEIKVNTPISSEYGIRELMEEGYKAVFLGTGAWKGAIPISGADALENVFDGVSFLRLANKDLNEQPDSSPQSYKMNLAGKNVVIVGGGNVAIDAARVSKRLGAREVQVVYRRTREEMPALPEEIVDAEKEGIQFDFLVSPVQASGDNGTVAHIECLRNSLSEPDESGRRKPVPVNGSEFKINADVVVCATGQKPELSFLQEEPEGVDDRGRIAANPATMETPIAGVFAGGDAVTGPASAIKAMAAGKKAAASIDAYLRGKEVSAGIMYPVKRKSTLPLNVSTGERAAGSNIDMHALYMEEKQESFDEIVQVASQEDAVAEASRCLRCDICIACGECVDTCSNKVGVDALELGYVDSESTKTDFNRPVDKCVGCATCSVNCPTGAITQEDKDGFREMRMCGALMSRLQLISCDLCGHTYATEKHLQFVKEKMDNDLGEENNKENICPECARSFWTKKTYAL